MELAMAGNVYSAESHLRRGAADVVPLKALCGAAHVIDDAAGRRREGGKQ
jgi:hypothetical protein